MQDNNAKKLPKFYLVLIICWAIALALLAVALLVIRTYLADYESVQPKYVAEEVFENYFSGVADTGFFSAFFRNEEQTAPQERLITQTVGPCDGFHSGGMGLCNLPKTFLPLHHSQNQ